MTVTVTVTVTARVILFTYLRLKGRVAEQGYVNTVVKQFKVKIQYKIKYNKKTIQNIHTVQNLKHKKHQPA